MESRVSHCGQIENLPHGWAYSTVENGGGFKIPVEARLCEQGFVGFEGTLSAESAKIRGVV
jgi:hypothetical protein